MDDSNVKAKGTAADREHVRELSGNRVWIWSTIGSVLFFVGAIIVFNKHAVQANRRDVTYPAALGSSTAIPSDYDSNGPLSKIRGLQIGDKFVSTGTGMLRLPDGSAFTITSATITMVVWSVQQHDDWMATVSDFVLNLDNGKTIQYYETDYYLKGSNVKVGDNGGPNRELRLLSEPRLIFPESLAAGQSLTADLDYQTGLHIHDWMTVMYSGSIDTGAGKFPCWVMGERETRSDGSTGVETQSYIPSLGVNGQSEITATRTDGSLLSLNTVLQSTNVTIPQTAVAVPQATIPTSSPSFQQFGTQLPTVSGKPHFGFGYQPYRGFIVVTNVYPGSPAAEAGIQPGMGILSIDGQPVRQVDDISQAQYQRHRIGDVVPFTVSDGTGSHNVNVRLGSDAEPWGAAVR